MTCSAQSDANLRSTTAGVCLGPAPKLNPSVKLGQAKGHTVTEQQGFIRLSGPSWAFPSPSSPKLFSAVKVWVTMGPSPLTQSKSRTDRAVYLAVSGSNGGCCCWKMNGVSQLAGS